MRFLTKTHYPAPLLLLAGTEVTQLLKQHPYGIDDNSVQVAR